MKNLKHTKEYATEIAKDYEVNQGSYSKEWLNGFIKGYMKAIEETAAPELLEALIEVRKHMTAHIPERIFDLVDNALTKATKQLTHKTPCERH